MGQDYTSLHDDLANFQRSLDRLTEWPERLPPAKAAGLEALRGIGRAQELFTLE